MNAPARHAENPDPRSTPEDQRLALASLRAEAEDFGRPRIAQAFQRLALMGEVFDCLAESSPVAAAEAAAFNTAAYERLTDVSADDEQERAASWVLTESSDRWGEYLELLDPDWSRATEPTELATPDPAENEPGDIDASALILLLTGAAPEPAPLPPPPPVSRPKAPVRTAPAAVDHAPAVEQPAGPVTIPAVLSSDSEIRETFLDEAGELFERVEALLLDIASEAPQPEKLHEMGRCLHTLKGAAGSVEWHEVVGLVHTAEERLEAAHGKPDDALLEHLHALLRDLERLFAAARSGSRPHATAPADVYPATATPTLAPLLTAVEERPNNPASPPHAVKDGSGEGPVRVAAERIDELMDIASELIARRGLWAAQAGALKELEAVAKGCRARMASTIDHLRDLRPEALASTTRGRATSEVTELIRRLIEQSEDLVVLVESAQASARPFSDNSDALATQTLQLWEALQAIRIVPVRGLFQRLTRVAHEAARIEGRRVEVVTLGEETGVDRAVQDKAYEPLLHVVRNAVCHGIEPAEERTRAGKAATGRITLEANRSGNTLVLSVRDDGRGLDHEAILAKGRRLGLIGPHERPSDDRLNSLIFQSGFSTRDSANTVAGRGVGMDVVSQEVARLHGSIALESRRGQGTRLHIALPARLALEQSMVLRIDGQAFALPVELIELADTLDSDAVDTAGPSPRLLVRDELVPMVSARDALGFSQGPPVPCPKVLLIRAAGRPLAVVVDAIEGTQELVVRPLGPLLLGHPLVAGASLSVTGEVIFALNPAGLGREPWVTEGRGGTASTDESPRSVPILVADDSISVRTVVARELRRLGYEVEEVSDGLDALSKLRANTYGLVLSDLEMPRMDGFELLAELSRLMISPEVPVLVTSTRSDSETRRRVNALGAREFLAKPIEPEELAAKVRAHFRASGRSRTVTAEPCLATRREPL